MAALSTLAMATAAVVGGVAAGKALRPVLNPKDQKGAVPVVPELPAPIDTAAESALAESEATKARMRTRTESQRRNGRRATLLTNPATLGSAAVQRKTLLGS